MSETWTIGELAERAAGLLGSEPHVSEPRVNGRVRDVPNERLIRWYTTIGLLDPPLARRGRVAVYGRRHLLQLVAIKRRQADGLSIAAIQAELAGATDTMLQRIADLPGIAHNSDITDHPGVVNPSGGGDHPKAVPSGATAARDRFWTRPAPPPERALPDGGMNPAGAVNPVTAPVLLPVAAPLPGKASEPADVAYGVRLAPGVTMMLDNAGRTPTTDEVAALRRAAEPLLATLAMLGLTDRSDHAEGMTP